MKKLYSLLCATMLVLASCTDDQNDEYEALTAKNFQVEETYEAISGKSVQTCATSKIIANETINAGKIIVETDGTNLIVTYKVDIEWQLDNTNLYLGDIDDVPTHSNGTPRTRSFPYRAWHSSRTNKVVYTIPLDDIDLDCFAILGHAIVTKYDKRGNAIYCTNSWVKGKKFSSNSWAMRSTLCKSGCTSTTDGPVIQSR